MDRIKSAWEIAEEKTRGVAVDKKSIEERGNVSDGKKLASQFLDDPEKYPFEDALKKTGTAERKAVKRGVMEALLANLTLPLSELAETRNRRAAQGLTLLAPQEKQLGHILKQVDSFFKNFSAEREHIEEALEEQYQPRLKQKAAALAKQLGAAVDLKAIQDPEFVALLKKNLSAFDERYLEALREAKTEIERLVLAAIQ